MENLRFELIDSIQLENIIHIEYNQESLKKNFALLVEFLKGLGKNVKALQDSNANLTQKNVDLSQEIERIKAHAQKQDAHIAELKSNDDSQQRDIDRHTQEIDELRRLIDALQNSAANKADLDKLRKELDLIKQELESLKLFQPAQGGASSGSVSDEALKRLLAELQRLREEFRNKTSEIDSEIEKVWAELAKKGAATAPVATPAAAPAHDYGPAIAALEKRLAEIENSVKTKSEKEYVVKELQALREIIAKLGSGGQVVVGSVSEGQLDEINKHIADTQKQLEDLRQKLAQLRKEHDDHKQQYADNKRTTDKRLDELERVSKGFAHQYDVDRLTGEQKIIHDSVDTVQNYVKEHEKKIKEIMRMLEYLRDKIKDSDGGRATLTSNNNVAGSGGSGVTEEYVDERLGKLRDDLMSLLKALREDVGQRVTFDDLWKSEALILEKLDEVAGALLKKLADKGDTKKALIYLEKKINQLYMLVTKEGGKSGEEDALIVKRPLFWSCVSCDKNLNSFQGKLGDYKHWAVFPPKETTPERMGRFGKGYMTMLEKSRAKEERMRAEAGHDMMQSTGTLPNVHKTPGLSAQGSGFDK